MNAPALLSRVRAWWTATDRERSAFERNALRRYRRWEVAAFALVILAALFIIAADSIGPWPGTVAFVAWSFVTVSADQLWPGYD